MRIGRIASGAMATFAAGLLVAACGEVGADGRAGGEGTDGGDAEASAREAWPEGWRSRTDGGDTARSAVRLEAVEGGVRVRPGPRAIYWRSGDSARDAFRAEATFSQMERARAPESYGLFVGGRDLEGSDQDYLYFLVRQTGEYLVKHRAGEETHDLVAWSGHPAVRSFEEGADSLVNRLAVEAGPERVRFLVNGTAVDSLDRAARLNTDGQVGVRLNHRLDVRIAGPEIADGSAGGAGASGGG